MKTEVIAKLTAQEGVNQSIKSEIKLNIKMKQLFVIATILLMCWMNLSSKEMFLHDDIILTKVSTLSEAFAEDTGKSSEASVADSYEEEGSYTVTRDNGEKYTCYYTSQNEVINCIGIGDVSCVGGTYVMSYGQTCS